MTGALNSLSYLFLILGGCSGDTAGQQLALLVHEFEQKIGIFIIDILDAVFLEAAVFLFLGVYRNGSQIFDLGASLLCHDSDFLRID